MEPETQEQRQEYVSRLESGCEELGLAVSGTTVVVPLGRPFAVDASCVDLGNLAACLMYLAYQAGRTAGADEARKQVRTALDLHESGL